MRPIERIPIVLQTLPLKEYIESFGILSPEDINTLIDIIDIETLKQFWEKNPDLRLTQVLVSMDYIPNVAGFWYYTEEYEWLIDNHILEPRDILFWGVRFDAEMNPVTPHNELIKNLETAHIEAILEGGFAINSFYMTTFQSELVLRKEEIGIPFCSECYQENASAVRRDDGKYRCDDCAKDQDYIVS